MKILATSDLHQMPHKWKLLVEACKKEKPDIITVAGDLFPFNDAGIRGQLNYYISLEKYDKKIKAMGAKLVMIMGNDDNILLEERIIEEKNGLWYYVSNKIMEIDGYEFVGMPYVPDYPFGYKQWCRAETKDNLRIDVQWTEPVLINKDNGYDYIEDLEGYYKSLPNILDTLRGLADKVKDIKKSIWLIHAPPANLNIDVCSRGAKPGSHSVLQFITEYQPFLTIHGHIHESPEYNGKVWIVKQGNTICVQAGQITPQLYYTVLDVENGTLKKAWHSIYGDTNYTCIMNSVL